MERAAGDAAIADFLRRNQSTVESIFAGALRRAQSRGKLSHKSEVHGALIAVFAPLEAIGRYCTEAQPPRRAATIGDLLRSASHLVKSLSPHHRFVDRIAFA